jgi:hypothetical protein
MSIPLWCVRSVDRWSLQLVLDASQLRFVGALAGGSIHRWLFDVESTQGSRYGSVYDLPVPAGVRVDDCQSNGRHAHRTGTNKPVKGLEWPYVIVYDASSTVFPHRLSTDIEEERSVFHVAITRCTASLVITADAESPSIFLNELSAPADLPRSIREAESVSSHSPVANDPVAAWCTHLQNNLGMDP